LEETIVLLQVLWYCLEESRNQWLKPAELSRLQEKRLKAIVRHAYDNVPLYHEKFDSIGVKPDDINTVEDLVKLPFMTKQEIWRGIPDRSIAKEYDLKDCIERSTSGTSGGPMPVYYDRRYFDRYVANKYYRMQRATGFEFGDKLLEIYYTKQQPQVGTGESDRAKRLNRRSLGREALGKSFSLFKRWIRRTYITYSAEEIISDIIDYQPKRIYANASYLRLLAETIKEKGIEGVRPKALMSWGEVLDEPTRKFLELSFGCPVYSEYGMVEIGAITWECEKREGLHVTTDSLVLEVVRDGVPVGPGEQGEIVITGLLNYAMPLIRYRVGDLGILDDHQCSCGRSFPLLKSVEGRIVDCLILSNGRIVTPKTMMTTVQSTPGVSRYQVVQENEKKVTIELMRKESDPEVRISELISNCKAVLGDDVDIEVFIGDRKNLKAKFRPVISKLTINGEPRWTTPRG
jgi:phenylacetate-CoA ligase